MCKRGDVYYVDFGQNTDSCVQCGIRPALVVSNNRANASSPVITVIPLTARTYKRRSIPTHVLVPKAPAADCLRTAWPWRSRSAPLINLLSWRRKAR